MRAVVSDAPPTAYGTIMCTAHCGYVCATAAPATASRIQMQRFITSSLVRRDAGLFDDLGPLRDVGLHIVDKLRLRHRARLEADRGEALAHVGLRQRRIDSPIEELRDLLRQSRRPEERDPRGALVVRETDLRERRHVRQLRHARMAR